MSDILEKARARHARSLHRAEIIKSVIVTTTSGNKFNADETSQQRIHRAVEILNENEMIQWILADNTVATITRAELREALRLAFLQQAALHLNQT